MSVQGLNDLKKVYFVGIGGIGMSAIARYMNNQGIEVYGYDLTQTPLTDKLSAEGMKIHYEENIKMIPKGIDLVVYTPAVPKEHLELTYFRTNNYPVKKRAEVLGIISRSKRTIAVAGTHGKTTTTSILTHLLKTGGVDCTAFLGGIAGNFESNYVAGKSDWVVVEADEFDRSFLHLSPKLAIITSMDADHLDIYGTASSVVEGFNLFAQNCEEKLFHKNGLQVKTNCEYTNYGVNKGDYRAVDIHVDDGFMVFDLISPKGNVKNIRFTHSGNHNVENAVAAIAIAQELGVEGKYIKKAMASFKGIKRRFEIVTKNDLITYVDDYAHHPEELKAAIAAAKVMFPGKKITGIFQPHLYTRTRDFVEGFAEALDELDRPVLIPIYPARELPIEGVSSKIIFDKMKNSSKRLLSKEEALTEFSTKESITETEVLMTLGAGNIDQLVPEFKTAFEP